MSLFSVEIWLVHKVTNISGTVKRFTIKRVDPPENPNGTEISVNYFSKPSIKMCSETFTENTPNIY